jgi:hypothetical protein
MVMMRSGCCLTWLLLLFLYLHSRSAARVGQRIHTRSISVSYSYAYAGEYCISVMDRRDMQGLITRDLLAAVVARLNKRQIVVDAISAVQ